MKTTRIFFVFVILSMLLLACEQSNKDSEQEKESAEVNKQQEEVMLSKIKQHEKKLHESKELNRSKANEMILLYLNYASEYDNDSLVPEYLFRAAELAMNVERPYDAVAYLQRIDKNYPDFDKMSWVVYLTGFIYDSMLEKDETAKKYYTRFLDKWPDHPRAEEVEILISYLNMSDEELIKSFEKSNKSRSL